MQADEHTAPDPDAQRTEQIDRWETASRGWGIRAEPIRAFGMPVSERMIDRLALQPGQRVLELAAGPGDTGFLAAELIRPGGTLLSSDIAEGMLEVARRRAAKLGIGNVEFARLNVEWIDLPTASVDAVLCRWGLMLAVDPDAAGLEMRRVVRPGGRIAVAVWDDPAVNPWATVPTRALVSLGHVQPPDPAAPGMFALAAPGRLAELLEGAGFDDVVIETVDVERASPSAEAFLAETADLSSQFAEVLARLSESERAAVSETIAGFAEPFTSADGAFTFPGRTLVATASA